MTDRLSRPSSRILIAVALATALSCVAMTAGRAQPADGKTEAAPPEPAQPAAPPADVKPPDAPAGEKPAAEKPSAEKPSAEKPWVTLAALPQPATDLAGVTVNGKLYLFGGLDGIRPTGLVLEYDAATDAWTKKKPMPVNLHRFAVAAYGDKIYLFGGFKYPDTRANAWQPVDRQRVVSQALQAYAALATSADRGAVRDLSQLKQKR